MNVTLFSSIDGFITNNDSITMLFDSQDLYQDNFTFVYDFAGRDAGTYLQYYYVVEDGDTTITKYDGPVGSYFDLQWVEATIGPVIPTNVPSGDPSLPTFIIAQILRNQFIFFLFLVMLSVLSMVTAHNYRAREAGREITYSESITEMASDVGRSITQGTKFVSEKINNGFTFIHDRVEGRIQALKHSKIEVVPSKNIKEVSQIADKPSYCYCCSQEKKIIIFLHEIFFNCFFSSRRNILILPC